jgi:hypothetical protein
MSMGVASGDAAGAATGSCSSCALSPAPDPDDQAPGISIRHRAFSTRRNFLPTYIRQRHSFGALGRTSETLLATVLSALIAEASIVAGAGRAMIRGAPELAARLATVLLPVVVGSAQEERHDAPEARQLVDSNGGRIQGSGCDRQKLGRRPEP